MIRPFYPLAIVDPLPIPHDSSHIHVHGPSGPKGQNRKIYVYTLTPPYQTIGGSTTLCLERRKLCGF